MITEDFQAARAEYSRLYPGSPFFDIWIPESHFLKAEFDGAGNFTTDREDDGIYGIALGPNPSIPLEWKNFSIETQGANSLPPAFTAVEQWDCYFAPTVKGEVVSTPQSSDIEIEDFLKTHAPESSVMPGNAEIIQWAEVHHDGALAAVAALCRWESGGVVIASVATHADLRGRGIGKELMRNCLAIGDTLGEKLLCLGVRHLNESAQRLYQGMGFTLMHNFTYCERR